MTSYNTPLVRQSGNRLITTSLAISQHFGKKHKNVLQAIERLDCSPEFNGLNFQPVSYLAGNGEKRPMYEVTRDGFTFLCMGFTGKHAAQWKERYIAAFNALEQQRQPENRLLDTPTVMRRELLSARPQWRAIAGYMRLGLKNAEIARLIQRSPKTVRQHQRRMAACGVLPQRTPQQLGFDYE